jgi:hypothetical protein
MRIAAVVLALAACGSKHDSALSAADRELALTAAKQCIETVESLAPSYQMVGPKLATALKMDKVEAQRLMRDSIELLISTRELLCKVSEGTVRGVLDKAPTDEQIAPAHAHMQLALERLAKARAAYDALLGAATSGPSPSGDAAIVDEAALLDRFTRALVGN